MKLLYIVLLFIFLIGCQKEKTNVSKWTEWEILDNKDKFYEKITGEKIARITFFDNEKMNVESLEIYVDKGSTIMCVEIGDKKSYIGDVTAEFIIDRDKSRFLHGYLDERKYYFSAQNNEFLSDIIEFMTKGKKLKIIINNDEIIELPLKGFKKINKEMKQ
ncbi:hypothetical protein [Fusobacterium sp. PH5-44]|uniref:hypothetical protein n=1 Tax=unclassified Fusobacterium TaxID=2648384 RepID=UPI003D19BC43